MIIFLVELQKMSHRLMDDDPHCPISLKSPSLVCAAECCLHWAPATCCMSSSQTQGQSTAGRRRSSAVLHLETWQWTFWSWFLLNSGFFIARWFNNVVKRPGSESKQTTMRQRQILPRNRSTIKFLHWASCISFAKSIWHVGQLFINKHLLFNFNT